MKRLLAVFVLAGFVLAEEAVDRSTTARFRSEEMEHSQLMRTLHMLTDRFGPRVTGTPNHEAAAKWAIAQLAEWGLKNGHLEPWDFGHPGWTNERASGLITAPVQQNLKFEVLAWTPSTNGTTSGLTIQLVPPQGPEAPRVTDDRGRSALEGRSGRGPTLLGPTRDEMERWVAASREKVHGKMVMIGSAAVVPVDFEPPAKAPPRH